jgi:mycofactocin system creatininase family protein
MTTHPVPRTLELARLTSPELAGHRDFVLFVPIGSTEQHGPHLPLSTDTLVACELARRLVQRWEKAVLAPAIPYGSSGEHEGFPGTVSIGQEALEHVVVELCRSASTSFAATVLVSGHGGNAEPLERAVARLWQEGRRVRAVAPRLSGDAHAGRVETSLVLALAPLLVRLDRAAAGATAPLSELIGALRASGLASVTPNGVLGDPFGATAEEGQALLDKATEDLVSQLKDFVDRLSP